jgi:Skp family chaperone for outer membrane proteins
MTRFRTTAVALVSAVAFGSAAAIAVPSAFADDVPCATQQAHVDKATAKLADLTAKFAAHPNQKNLKAKKAQVQRLAHATTRLENCLADQA